MQQQTASGAKAKGVSTTVEPFQVRGRFLTAVALKVAGRPDAAFYAALDEHLTKTPQFFDDAPVVLDLSQVGAALGTAELAELVEELRRRELAVFGVQNATPQQITAAQSAGLIALSGGREAPLRGTSRRRTEAQAAPRQAEAAPAATSEKPAGSKLVTEPVRSGQTVVAEHGDLVVVGHVSSGAELVATGNVHVYGRLKGRAMAGANGDERARIFCRSLDAELLAIAGLYRTNENLDAGLRDGPVQVFLQNGHLKIEPFG